LYAAAFADLCRYLNIPFMGTAGASDSKLNDAQAIIESTLQLVFSSLSGTPLIHDLGFLDGAALGSLTMVVILDELVSMLKRIMRGVEVNADTIMLDLIEQVGPGGHFIAEQRSSALCRQEVWVPMLMDRDHHTVWEHKGGLNMEQRACQKLHHILSTHLPQPLSTEAQYTIKTTLAQFDI
jgi:trimethylamine--corrinoid protein Co-methyltransferase